MSQYFGKTIALISNKGLRYVGLLDKISAEDATVSLKSVRSFGTEGRMAEQGHAAMEVMPGSDIYEYVVFRGSDVKDLTVLDVPIDQVRPVLYYPPPATNASPQNPHATAQSVPATAGTAPGPTPAPSATSSGAVESAKYASEQYTTRDNGPAYGAGSAPAAASPAASASVPQETGQYPAAKAPAQAAQSAQSAQAAQIASDNAKPTPTASEPQAPTKTTSQAPRERSAPVPKQDFNTAYDFEEANKRFEKERHQDAASKPTYDKKSSFFDSISSNEHNNSMRWNEEKNLNLDTFGEAYARRGRGGFRGGRGRGRGNGYRGRGRGNFRGRGSSEPKPEWA